ncbi:AAA family ATPase [Chitinophaga sp. HK235]|uniref:AAA family ATPase n=1 Tax=Chitinophaga sp. HK235 TaxID=2952571 RepID=UPI001BACD048|nr:AAA family ATPase [Chitinophaga sp. HK235]
MHINRLLIQNFRGFESLELRLNPKFTVAIGDNGKGKSSLLHALQVSLGAYLQCLPIPASAVYRRQFKPQERFVKWNSNERDYFPNQTDTLIQAWAYFDDTNPAITWTRRMLKSGVTSHSGSLAGELIFAVTHLLFQREKHHDEILPVVASFGTERTVAQQRKGKKAQQRRSRMEKGYLAALSNKVDFDGVLEWLHNYDSELKYNKEFEGTRDAVFNAITTAIPYLEDVAYNNRYQELEAAVTIDEHSLGRMTHSNMSDGLIAMLNMVAELAFRCVILNGFLGTDAVRKTTGVVLIDELDMHLHPNWQRHVVADLKRAFPNIQFIVTTHSAFIVQSLESDELYNLDKPTDIPPKDLKIDEVATAVMGVPSPFSDENTNTYNDVKSMLLKFQQHGLTPELKDEINNIADPALRAFLELNIHSKEKK